MRTLVETETVGARVRRLRDERGYTQGQVVEYTNARLERSGDPLRLTREWLSFVETGRIERPERERLEALAGTLGLPAANLLAAAGYRVAAVPVPDDDPRDLIRLALSKLDRERDIDLNDPELEAMLKEVGGELDETEREGVKTWLRHAKARRDRRDG